MFVVWLLGSDYSFSASTNWLIVDTFPVLVNFASTITADPSKQNSIIELMQIRDFHAVESISLR